MQRELWGQGEQEIALEERGDGNGDEEELGGGARGDEREEVLFSEDWVGLREEGKGR